MPRGFPKNKEGISKMEGVRRALAELSSDAQNKDIQKFLKSEFGIVMDTKMVSNYKTHLKSASKSAVIRKPEMPAMLAMPVAESAATDGITLEDIRAVKEVLEKVSAEKVMQLAEVLG